LQDGKVRGAVRRGHNDFTVDNRGAGVYVPRVVGNFPKAFGPVVSAPGEHFHGGIPQMHLNAISVELISWIQRVPFGTVSTAVASAGATNPGNGAFTAIFTGFSR